MRVLIVDDDIETAAFLRRALDRLGHAVDIVADGNDAVWMATEVTYDAIVLDVNIPPPDGFEVCRHLRAHDVWSSVLFLTGRNDVVDRVAGLDAGGDDYLVKPFSVAELDARLRAVRRRGNPVRPPVIRLGNLEIDPNARTVRQQGLEVALTAKEFQLLEALAQSRGDVLSRSRLQERLWDFAFEARSNIVDALVRRVRAKLDIAASTATIETVRGVGYRISVKS